MPVFDGGSDGHTVYSDHWLDSCHQQTLLPGAPWHVIEQELGCELATRASKQFAHPERRAVVLDLLGSEFVSQHFPDELNSFLLDSLEPAEREILMNEGRSWLQNQLYKVVADLGYQQLCNLPIEDVRAHPQIATFLQHAYTSFHNGLERHLYLSEKQRIDERKKSALNRDKRKHPTPPSVVLPAPSVLRASTGTTVVTHPYQPDTPVIKEQLYKLTPDLPRLWGDQSDDIGRAVVSLLDTDPRKFDHVAARLHGRQLPASLRRCIWTEVLLKVERETHKDGNVERLVRERFGNKVQRGMTTLRVKRATQSPIHGLINNAVCETYSKTVGLVPFKSGSHLKEASHALNVLYTYDHSYEPYLIHWLFPLQVAYMESVPSSGEHVYELAMYLDLLRSNCFPKWPQIYATAERVMNTIEKCDKKLHDHLKTIGRIHFNVNPKEFLVQLIRQEMDHGEQLDQHEGLNQRPLTQLSQTLSPLETATILADPIVFVRKWIGEGFVGVLDNPAVMYVWDQCFLSSWKRGTIDNFCVAIVLLLSHKFSLARDYGSMKQVFLHEPCKLYTLDIQRAWLHLESDHPPTDVPHMNRQRPPSPPSRRESVVSAMSLPPLHMCGVKDIAMKLVLPAASLKKATWLKNFDAASLTLDVSLHYGSVRLWTQAATTPAEVTRTEVGASGGCTILARVPNDVFAFDNVDLSLYDVERELGGSLYIVVGVSYIVARKTGDISTVPLGWARVTVFRQDSTQNWMPQLGDHTFPLHPGIVPDGLVSPAPPQPTTIGDGLLGYNSELTVVVYDPHIQPDPSPPRVTAAPTPSPQNHSIPTPLPAATPLEKSPTPKLPTPPPPPPPSDKSPWVAHDPETVSPTHRDNTQPFDIYIDSVLYIPDNASIVKMTGRSFQTGKLGQLPDILALPVLSSSARCPRFDHRLTINDAGATVDTEMLLMLRVYTVDVVTETVVAVGSCIVPVYNTIDKQVSLNEGGHQLRLHHGLPGLTSGPASLTRTSLDQCPQIPACSVLVRLLPHTQDPVPAPGYSTGYYKSSACKPTTSESRIYMSYNEHMAYPSTCAQMVHRLQTSEGVALCATDEGSLSWLAARLDQKTTIDAENTHTNVTATRSADNMNLVRCVRYRLRSGMMVQIRQAFGLKDVQYVQCFARVAPGSTALGMRTTDDGHGSHEKLSTLRLDYDALLSAPAWRDPYTEIHPFYDEYSCVVIQMFGLKVQYKPTADHSAPGTVTPLKGTKLDLSDQAVIGWAVVPLFQGNSVLSGDHYAPLFRGQPPREILEALSKNTVDSVLRSEKWTRQQILSPASIRVTLWDGHFDYDQNPVMPEYESQLQIIGDVNKYRSQRSIATGNRLSSIVLGSLQKKDQKGGTKGGVYVKEQAYFDDVMKRTYYDLIESALMTAGFGPL